MKTMDFTLPPIEIGDSIGVLATENWGITRCQIDALRQVCSGKGVEVAVLDTGIDPNHPEFAGRILEAESFIPGQAFNDGHGHGTHCASTIGGASKLIGVNPNVKFRIYKVLSNGGSGPTDGITRAVQLATQRKVNFISASIGGGGRDPELSNALAAFVAQGGKFIAAAGNSRPNRWEFPGNDPSALAVAAYDQNDRIANFSSPGESNTSLATGAPGVNIIGAKPGGGYQPMSGTSMATPFGCGVGTLIESWFIDHEKPVPNALWYRMMFRNWNIDAGTPGLDTDFGPGLINGQSIMRYLTQPEML